MEANKRRYQYDNVRTSYLDGNAVRKLNTAPDIRRQEHSAPIPEPRRGQPAPRRQEHRQPKQLSGINMASLLVLTVAIITTLYFCVEYLQLQYDVGKMEKDIVSMETKLIAMRNENDATYEQINSNYDLEYVYQMAVGELGMVYPNNNKVITYQKNDVGYVRQYQDIPE